MFHKPICTFLPWGFASSPPFVAVSGALSMIADGALEGVCAVFSGHLDRAYPVGTVIVHDGCVNASCDMVDVEIRGKSCHAARPHEGHDALLMASEFVVQAQHIVSRIVDPAEPAVVTIGKLDAGTAFNIVAGTARLLGTIRATRIATRDMIRQHVVDLADAVARVNGGTARVEFKDSTPPVINSPQFFALAQQAAEEAVVHCEEQSVHPLPKANMGGEDFAEYVQKVPGFFVRYGAGFGPDQPAHSAHSPHWDFNEKAMLVASKYLARVAVLAGTFQLQPAAAKPSSADA